MEDIDFSIVKQEPFDENNADFQSFSPLNDAMPIDTIVFSSEIEDVALSEPETKQEFEDSEEEPFDENNTSNDAMSIDKFRSSNEIEEVTLEIKQESGDSEDSEDPELKELRKEKNKQKRIKNNLISENVSILSYAKSCPNCKKSFNSSLIKKKAIHFKSCCNSKKRWVEERELVTMIDDLKFKFKSMMEKRKQTHSDCDYDSSNETEVTKDLETKKIYDFFPMEKPNVCNKKSVNDNKVKNEEDIYGFPLNNHKSLNKKEIKDEEDQYRS
ncbi:hypothetical protein C1645_872825 [Glomus cerebriforme]|uniref:Uncharacterized protein n=1 Tax=Glomus cerebriforme TaxID=658196 RepID=A0A397TAM2_9GLOM|nr:hypothetical protein C1645_872825 [Glomus cerebriforme]